MKNNPKPGRKTWLFVTIIIILIGVVILLLVSLKPMPVGLISEFGASMLWEEGTAMNECADCHDAESFHTCDTCHDDHGAVELENVRFYAVIELTGDVPDPSFVRINDILPQQDNAGTHNTLFDFLDQNGVDTFDSVTFLTNDGGLSTITRDNLDETSMLVPYMDGVRFITESVHSSTWLKGIVKIIVVGSETPLLIDGKATSIGRLLIGETERLTVEGSNVMLTDDEGDTSEAFVANWIEGTALLPLLDNPSPASIIITTSNGEKITLTQGEFENAIIGIIKDQITLILPERGRSAWPTNITEIESK